MLELHDIGKKFGRFTAVESFDLALMPGDILGLLGPNGAGKTTLMRMASGFLRPDQGRVIVGGRDLAKSRRKALGMIGYLPEGSPAYGEMEVSDFLDFCARARNITGRAKDIACARAMERTQIDDVANQPVQLLSKGYKRRLGLAQAILAEPPLLLLDEPTDGLDPNQRSRMRVLIRELAEHAAVLISTHLLDEVEAICNRTVIMAKGQKLLDSTPAALKRAGRAHHHIRMELDAAQAERVANILLMDQAVGGLRAEATDDGHVALLLTPEEEQDLLGYVGMLAHQYGWDLHQIGRAGGGLADVFKDLTRSNS